MADIQSRVTRHAKKQENLAHNNEKKKSINTDSEMIQIIELMEKDIKTFIMFYMFKRVEKRSSMINRVMEAIKKKSNFQKTTIFLRKMTIDGIHSRLSSAEETLSILAIENENLVPLLSIYSKC